MFVFGIDVMISLCLHIYANAAKALRQQAMGMVNRLVPLMRLDEVEIGNAVTVSRSCRGWGPEAERTCWVLLLFLLRRT